MIADRNEGTRSRMGLKEHRHAPSRGGLRNGNPCQPPQGRGLRRRGTGRTSGRGNPQYGVAWRCVLG